MAGPKILDTPSGRQIAYHFHPGRGPLVVFLGGFMSDMEGTKAIHLENWARDNDRSFLRFDYSGHGQSSGVFANGAISDWFEDACAVINAVAHDKVILVGSSMGGWISLLFARKFPQQSAALVTIAAAPDFTEDGYWASFDEPMRRQLAADGYIEVPSEYGAPYVISKRLIEDGRHNLVLRDPLNCPFPVRMLQGTDDNAVSTETALRLLSHITAEDMQLTLVKHADHRFSSEECLNLLTKTLEEVSASAKNVALALSE